MKIAGIIAEFNPFHDGHKYLIDEVRARTGADRILVLMSGDFVQRGLPAISEKRVRAKMALLNGVDVILNLPVRYATSSAEAFAYNAVKILDGLGCIDFLAFGSEEGSLERLENAADFFGNESEEYKENLNKALKEGESFAAARAKAAPEFADLINSPNNILGIEYIKAINKINSKMEPVTIERKTNVGFVGQEDTNKYSQGYYVRKKLMDATSMPGLNVDIPEEALKVLKEDLKIYGMTSEQDLSLLLADRLWIYLYPEVLSNFLDVSEDLAHTIVNKRNMFENFDDFADFIQTKNYTRTRINRALLHVVLGLRKGELDETCYFAQLLGFRREGEDLLKEIKKSAKIPFISKYSEGGEKLTGLGKKVFEEEIHASNLYETVRSQKVHGDFTNEGSKPIVIIG